MTMNMFQKKRPDRRDFAIEQEPHTYVGKPFEDQSAYTTHACGKERNFLGIEINFAEAFWE